jgi:tetratricopeptide (TPR) repeat protein/tRNA A-37 threonylcarbamoyl transferase component Bud32
MAHSDAARDLLFGLLALQTGLINQAQLVAAFHAWTQAGDRTMAAILAEQGALETNCLTLVEGLVVEHLRRHGSDPERSLAALGVGPSTRACLAQLGNRELDASLARVGSGSTEHESDPDRTATYSVGSATSEGQRFRVLRPHAQGGLGAVFVALDTELHREVALKQILDAHADDPASRQRFVLEAEVTGGLEHPGIVPVYGLGVYGDGRPYYAMRFIRGDSLKQAIERFHADEALKSDPGRRSLELRQLLRRFTDVCNAIDYAHSRGVLHRDLKPGNIIIGKHGETLVVDWGLAKATGLSDPSSGERTLLPSSASGRAETLPGSALGTPAYMSPEQAEGNLEALGPRSDVYSLGATLYCLLTGRPPLAGEPGDVLRAVQQGEFRPPRLIDPSLDRALEAVCLKAMALKPEDRYGSCRALAEDLERWMADEPVTAWHEPFGRRARRWARRHRTAVTGAAAAVLAGLIGLAAVALVQSKAKSTLEAKNLQLTAANTATHRALDETTKAQAQTQAALAQSEASRQQAKAVNAFLTEDLLTQAEPANTAAEDHVSLLEVLDRAAGKVGDRFAGQPEVEDALRRTIAGTYHGLASWAKAEVQWRSVLAASRRRLGVESPEALTAADELAHILRHRGRLDAEVLEMAKSAAEGLARILGPDHPDTLTSRNNLALAYLDAGRTAEAITLLEANLKQQESKLGPDHPLTLTSRDNLANAYLDAGRTAEAIMLLEPTLRLSESKLGPDHPDTLASRNNLALAYQAAGRTAEAIMLLEPTLTQKESRLGPDHPDTLTSRNDLARAYQAAGRTAEAITLHEANLKLFESKLGPDHPHTLTAMNNLARAYQAASRLTDALPLFEGTLKRCQAQLGPGHPITLQIMNNLAGAYLDARRWAEAERTARECLRLREKKQTDDWLRFHTMSQLGAALAGQKKYNEAEPLILAGYEGLKAREAQIPAPAQSRLAEAAARVVRLYEAWDKPVQATAWKTKLGMPDLPADAFAGP